MKRRASGGRRITPTERREELLDEIKDEIDRLCEIKSEPHRKAAAQDLAEYLALHYQVHA